MWFEAGKIARRGGEKEEKIISPLAGECRTQDSRLEDFFFFFLFFFFSRLNGSAVLSPRIHLADSFQDASTAYSRERVETKKGYVGTAFKILDHGRGIFWINWLKSVA